MIHKVWTTFIWSILKNFFAFTTYRLLPFLVSSIVNYVFLPIIFSTVYVTIFITIGQCHWITFDFFLLWINATEQNRLVSTIVCCNFFFEKFNSEKSKFNQEVETSKLSFAWYIFILSMSMLTLVSISTLSNKNQQKKNANEKMKHTFKYYLYESRISHLLFYDFS